MSQDIFVAQALVVADAFDNGSCRKGKGAGFVVIPVGMEGVDAVALPHLTIIIVLESEHSLEVHQYHYRLPGDVPAAYSDGHTLGENSFLAPGFQ